MVGSAPIGESEEKRAGRRLQPPLMDARVVQAIGEERGEGNQAGETRAVGVRKGNVELGSASLDVSVWLGGLGSELRRLCGPFPKIQKPN